MKKRKSLHGFLENKNDPISMKEIMEELKEDSEFDNDELDDAKRLATAWKKYCAEKHVQNNFNEYVRWLRTHTS